MWAAAWSELPRAMVSSAVGGAWRSAEASAATRAPSAAIWRAQTSAACSASSRISELNRLSFDVDAAQAQRGVQAQHVGAGAGGQAAQLGQAQVIGGAGGGAGRGLGHVQAQRDQVAQ